MPFLYKGSCLLDCQVTGMITLKASELEPPSQRDIPTLLERPDFLIFGRRSPAGCVCHQPHVSEAYLAIAGGGVPLLRSETKTTFIKSSSLGRDSQGLFTPPTSSQLEYTVGSSECQMW